MLRQQYSLMASRWLSLVAILLLTSIQVSTCIHVAAQQTYDEATKGTTRKLMTFVDCTGLCQVRCGAHSRPNVCTRACQTCCWRCKCVPPGTYGNREVCGKCYTDMTTHGNRPKCP